MWKSRDHSEDSRWFDETKGGGCAGWGQGSENPREGPLCHEKELLLTSRDSDELLRRGSPCWYFSFFQCWKVLKGGTTGSELLFQKIPLPKLAFPVSLAQLWLYSGIFPKVSTALLLKIVSLSLGAHNFTAQYFRRQYTCFHSLRFVLTPDCRSSASLSIVLLSQLTSHDGSHLVLGGDAGHLMNVELNALFISASASPLFG